MKERATDFLQTNLHIGLHVSTNIYISRVDNQGTIDTCNSWLTEEVHIPYKIAEKLPYEIAEKLYIQCQSKQLYDI